MSQSARVTSLSALVDLKAAFCVFTAEAGEALSSLSMEIQQTLNWLEEQQKYWAASLRRCEDAVFQAKNDLARRKMMRISDRPPDCTEQEEALQIAREKLAHAQEQLEKTRRWLRELPEAINDYEGPARQLGGLLEADMPKVDALLESKITSLDEYLQIRGPVQKSSPAAAPAEVQPDPAEKGTKP